MRHFATALVLCLAMTVSGCSWFHDKSTATAKAFIDCAKADVGQTVPEVGLTLLGAVAQIITAGADGWENALEKLGQKYGQDALACAAEAVSTVFTASHAYGVSPATARAQSFVESHDWHFKP